MGLDIPQVTQVFLELQTAGAGRDRTSTPSSRPRRSIRRLEGGKLPCLKTLPSASISLAVPSFTASTHEQSSLLLVVYMVTLFHCLQGAVSYGVLLLSPADSNQHFRHSGENPSSRGMKPLVMILVFTGVLNLFFTQDGRVLVDFWGITITTGGAERAAFMLVRILMLVTATFLLTYTTSPICPDGRAGTAPDESAEGHQGAGP